MHVNSFMNLYKLAQGCSEAKLMAEYRGTKAVGEKVSARQAWSAVMWSPNYGNFQLKSDTPWFYLAVIIT